MHKTAQKTFTLQKLQRLLLTKLPNIVYTFRELCSPKLSKYFETQRSGKERLLKHSKCKTRTPKAQISQLLH